MKREKREKLIIYLGAVTFIILAVGIGITMYMAKNQNNEEKMGSTNQNTVTNENTNINMNSNTISNTNTESASTQIGKSVEEQEKQEDNKKQETVKNENKVDTSKDIEKTDEQVVETKKEISFIKPVEGEIICEFAKDNLIYSETLKEWITHTAIDIKADKTSVVKSAADGIVKSIINDPRYGLTIIIEHDDGYQTVYSNLLTAEFVVEGEEVKQGQTIGTIGDTASFESSLESHLHFELLKDGEYLDPNIFLK